jgi:hypothetical protein
MRIIFSSVEAAMKAAAPSLYFCYCVQAWIRDGLIEACGHPQGFKYPCKACTSAGNEHHCQTCEDYTMKKDRNPLPRRESR